MKHFEEWFKQSGYCQDSEEVKIALLDAWDAALDSNTPKRGSSKTITYQNIIIGKQIKELLTTINDAEKIDCTCDQIQIATGYRCGCGKSMALQQASKELGKYLKNLRKGLK